jgi:hypothetical protein
MRDLAQVLPGNRALNFTRPSVSGTESGVTLRSLVGAPESSPLSLLFHFQAVGYSKDRHAAYSAIGSMQYSGAYNRPPT